MNGYICSKRLVSISESLRLSAVYQTSAPSFLAPSIRRAAGSAWPALAVHPQANITRATGKRKIQKLCARPFMIILCQDNVALVCKPKELECQGAFTTDEKSNAVVPVSENSANVLPQRFQCRRNGVQLFLGKLNRPRLLQPVTGDVANHQIIRANYAAFAQLLCPGDRRGRGGFGEDTGEPAYQRLRCEDFRIGHSHRGSVGLAQRRQGSPTERYRVSYLNAFCHRIACHHRFDIGPTLFKRGDQRRSRCALRCN